jgi:hypothetical protein
VLPDIVSPRENFPPQDTVSDQTAASAHSDKASLTSLDTGPHSQIAKSDYPDQASLTMLHVSHPDKVLTPSTNRVTIQVTTPVDSGHVTFNSLSPLGSCLLKTSKLWFQNNDNDSCDAADNCL